MISIKSPKNRLVKAIFGCFFGILGLILPFFASNASVYADPIPADANTTVVTDNDADANTGIDTNTNTNTNANTNNDNGEKKETRTCDASLGSLGWLVCPTTGKISEAVDWLYAKNKDMLEINPVKAEQESPIYQIWNYFLGVANLLFVIFLMVVVWSQITGVGINNYGVKKALPKLIIAAIMVNLSFLVCSLAVDLSNVIGNGLRGVFTTIEEATVPMMLSEEGYATPESGVAMTELYGALAGGTGLLTTVGFIAFEGGEIWMLIPAVLGALVSVVVGLITIALRQVVVILLIMIAPLAIVATILPNTESLFRKWKDLLIKMLVFYPMYSLLFGASSLAGWAIIASANDGFGLILGTAVKIFPLFFSWSLMKMSGTFLGTVNAKITGMFAKPLASSRTFAESQRELTRQKHLASNKVYTPTLKLRQFIADRKVIRDEETKEYAETARNRGLYLAAKQHYKDDDTISRDGEEAYEMQARNMRYKTFIERDKNNFNKGLGQLESVKNSRNYAMRARLDKLDEANVRASDELKMELSRGAKIDLDNAEGFYNRMAKAKNAQMDNVALLEGNMKHEMHGVLGDPSNLERFNTIKNVMEGNEENVNFAIADAAHAYNAQVKIAQGKFIDWFANNAPTQDIVNILSELSKNKKSNDYIDPIIAGLKTLNMRGDTDLVRKQVSNLMSDGKVEIGTHASQALANFFMFDVKGSDPFLRRFGKYINLETAKMFNEDDPENRRTRKDISFYEYVNGEYVDKDSEGHVIRNADGTPKMRKTKRKASILLKGTSFKDMERTAIPDLNETIREYSVDIDEDGNVTDRFNYEKFKKNQEEIWDAIMPNIISDQFSFLSGSEQVTALGKGVTGMDVGKHRFDWAGIFGDKMNDLTPEQKKDYIEFLNKRTKTFLGGQVPSQIAKTKTDILESVKNQYAFKDAVDNTPGFFAQFSNGNFEMNNEQYKQFENEHMEQIKKEFVGSFKDDALKGFVKMHHKGYQGEAKDGLIQLLDPDELYRQYFGNGNNDNNQRRRRQQPDDDDEDGMPVDMNGGLGGNGPSYNQTWSDVEDIYNTFTGASTDVAGFWNAAKGVITGSPMFDNDMNVIVDDIENGIHQFNSVAALYSEIVNRIFGGFNN